MATPPVSARARRTRTRTFCIRPSQKISPVAVVARMSLKESSATLGQGYQGENGNTCSRGDSRSSEARACNAVRKRRLGFQTWTAKLIARRTLRNGRTFRLRGTPRLENARQRLGAHNGPNSNIFLTPAPRSRLQVSSSTVVTFRGVSLASRFLPALQMRRMPAPKRHTVARSAASLKHEGSLNLVRSVEASGAKPCYHGNSVANFIVVSQTQCRCGQRASTSKVGKLVLWSRQRVSMRGSKTGFHRVVGG